MVKLRTSKNEMLVALVLMHAITLRTVIPIQLEEPDARAVHVSVFAENHSCEQFVA